MEEQLVINGKQYVCVAVAAELVGYSTTYVEQLARGKWVEASSIHGQFYVDIDALVRFVSLSEQQKKAEHESVVTDRTNVVSMPDDGDWLMISKAGIVTTCGVLAGAVLWSLQSAGVTGADLVAGAVLSVETVASIFADGEQMASVISALFDTLTR